MKTYTEEECESWFKGYGRDLAILEQRENCVTAWYPPNPANVDFLWIAQNLSFREPVLLWSQGAFRSLIKPPEAFSSGSGRHRITQDGTILSPAELHPPNDDK